MMVAVDTISPSHEALLHAIYREKVIIKPDLSLNVLTLVARNKTYLWCNLINLIHKWTILTETATLFGKVIKWSHQTITLICTDFLINKEKRTWNDMRKLCSVMVTDLRVNVWYGEKNSGFIQKLVRVGQKMLLLLNTVICHWLITWWQL